MGISLLEMLEQNKPQAPAAAPPMNPDQEMYSYYQNMFNTFAGNPNAQNSVIGEYYDYINPEKRRQREQQQQILASLTGGPAGIMGGGGMGGGMDPNMPAQPQLPDLLTMLPVGTNNSPHYQEGVFEGGIDPNIARPLTDIASAPAAYQAHLQSQVEANLPPEQQGRFGLGGGKGELFGEGGLVSSITQPIRQGIINPLATLGQSAAVVGGDLLQGRSLQDAMANPNAALENQAPLLVSDQEAQDYLSNPALGGLKSGAGIASYAVAPGSGTLLNTVGRTAAAGAMQGFGASRPGEEIGGIVGGGAIGGLTGGAIKLASPTISKLGSKIASKASSKLGKGGIDAMKLPKNMQAFDDVVKNDADSVFLKIEDIYSKNSVDATTKIGGLKGAALESAASDAGYIVKPQAGSMTKYNTAVEHGRELTRTFNEPFTAKGMLRSGEKLTKVLEQSVDDSVARGVQVDPTKHLFAPDDVSSLAAELGMTPSATEELLVSRMRGLTKSGKLPGETTFSLKGGQLASDAPLLSPRTVLEAKRGSYQGASSYYKALSKGSGNPGQKLILDKYINDATKNMLEEAVPGARILNTMSAEIAEYSPNFAKAYNTGMGGVNVASPQSVVMGLKQKATGTLGRAGEALLSGNVNIPGSGLVNKAAGGVANMADNIASRIPAGARQGLSTAMANPGVQAAVGRGLAGTPEPGNVQFVPSENGLVAMSAAKQTDPYGPEIYPQAPMQSPGGLSGAGDNNAKRAQMFNALTQGMGYSPAEAKTYVDMNLPEEKERKLSSTQETALQDAVASLEGLDAIDQLVDQFPQHFDPTSVGGRIQDLGGIFGSREREYVNNNLEHYTSILLKALSGAAASDKEREAVRARLPSKFDPPDVAKGKIQALREFAQRDIQNKLRSTDDLAQSLGY